MSEDEFYYKLKGFGIEDLHYLEDIDYILYVGEGHYIANANFIFMDIEMHEGSQIEFAANGEAIWL